MREGAALDAGAVLICGGDGELGGDLDESRFGFAKGKAVAADLNLKRVAERGDADERDARAGKHAHLAQAGECGAGLRIGADRGGGADGELGESGGGHGKERGGRGGTGATAGKFP